MSYTHFHTTYTEEVYAISEPVTVIIDTPWETVSSECRELLSKILGAVRCSPEMVRIVYQPKLDLTAWQAPPQRLIVFVQPPAGIALYELIQSPKSDMVISEPLSALLTNDASKRKLWEALKTLFPT